MNANAAIVSIHFPTRSEVRRLRRKARELGMTLSAYLRMVALKDVGDPLGHKIQKPAKTRRVA